MYYNIEKYHTKHPWCRTKPRLCHVTFSRVIGMPQYSALLSRRALTLGLSVLMGEVVLGRLESMHQHRMCPHYYCIPVDFCLIIVFLKSVVQAISILLNYMAFYIWVEVGVQLKLIIMWIVNSVNIWVWIGKLFIPYFISCYLTWKKITI